MKKKDSSKIFSLLVALSFLLLGCDVDNPFVRTNQIQKTKDSITSNSNVKEVTIDFLNPDDENFKSDWYKKNSNTLVMKVGAITSLLGSVKLQDGTISSNIEWSSSDNTIAVVNSGKVSAQNIGKTTIVATSILDSSIKSTINIEVLNSSNFDNLDKSKIKSIEAYAISDNISKNNVKIALDKTVSAIGIVTLSDDTKNSNVIWESSDSNIATVDESGKIIAKKVGVTTIVAKYKFNPIFKGIINLEVLDKDSQFPISPTLKDSSTPSLSEQIKNINNNKKERLVNFVKYLQELKSFHPADVMEFALPIITLNKDNKSSDLLSFNYKMELKPKKEYIFKINDLYNRYKKYFYNENKKIDSITSDMLNLNYLSYYVIPTIVFCNSNNEIIFVHQQDINLMNYKDENGIEYKLNLADNYESPIYSNSNLYIDGFFSIPADKNVYITDNYKALFIDYYDSEYMNQFINGLSFDSKEKYKIAGRNLNPLSKLGYLNLGYQVLFNITTPIKLSDYGSSRDSFYNEIDEKISIIIKELENL